MKSKIFKQANAKVILAFVSIFFVLPIASAHSDFENGNEIEEVFVGIYILNVGRFDVSTGSYTVDFYLDMICENPCSPENFEFLNGRATTVDKIIDTPTEKFYRIQASLSQNIDLRNYPFDKHSLTIEIEDKKKTASELVYEFDESLSGIDSSVIIVGWQLDGWEAKVVEHYYSVYDETFSRFIFSIDISRVVLTSVLKSFLPVFFMVLVGILSLMLRADKVVMRLSLNISTLLAAVMFHLNLTSTIPPVGYLTFADKFMISTYIILVAILASGVMLMRHTDKKDQEMAEKIYKYALYLIPVFAIILYSIIFWLQ